MLDIFSYFRRRRSPASRRPVAAGDEAIDLASIGGAINGTYVDIASLPAAAGKARSEASAAAAARTAAASPAAKTARSPNRRRKTLPQPPARPRRRADGNGAAPSDRKDVLSVHGVEKSFVGRKVVKGVSLYVRKGEAVGSSRPQRRRQDDGVLHDHRPHQGR